MAFFGFNKKKDVVDLTQYFNKQKISNSSTGSFSVPSAPQADSSSGMGFFGAISRTVQNSNQNTFNSGMPDSASVEEKKKRLAKRLVEMTDKIEELTNQVYHLQQRVEVLERKNNLTGFNV